MSIKITDTLKGELTSNQSLVLNGYVTLYKKLKTDVYKEIICDYFEKHINDDGTFISKPQDDIVGLGFGEALYFVYSLTKKEKYDRALNKLYQICLALPRNDKNLFVSVPGETQVNFNDLYNILPFYMNYETQFNKKENYNDIIAQFVSLRSNFYNEETKLYMSANIDTNSTYGSAKMLMTLVDTIEFTSEEIYEHYKKLFELFKEALAGILTYQDINSHLIYDTSDGLRHNLGTSLMTLYAMRKACSLGVLLTEKYEEIMFQMEEVIKPMLENNMNEQLLALNVKLSGVMSEV